MNYYIGQTFEGTYPPEAALWCNENRAKIERVNGVLTIVAIPEPTIEEQNAIIKQTRASLYNSLIDPLHAEKFRRSILNEWTPELEAEYVQKVTDLTTEIKTNNPWDIPQQEEFPNIEIKSFEEFQQEEE